jgi:hypothetical protein
MRPHQRVPEGLTFDGRSRRTFPPGGDRDRGSARNPSQGLEFQGLGTALAHRGEEDSARAADAALEAGGELGAHFSGMGYSALTHTALAAGDTDNREVISNASVVRQSFALIPWKSL